MTPQQINIAVAEIIGLVPCDKWKTFIAGASMVKGDCAHEKGYPINAPAHYHSSESAIFGALREKGCKYEINYSKYYQWHDVWIWGDAQQYKADGEKLCHTICKAFIKAFAPEKWIE